MMRIGGDHYRAVGRELGEIGEHNAADFGISQRVRLVADEGEPHKWHVGFRPYIQRDIGEPQAARFVELWLESNNADAPRIACGIGGRLFLERYIGIFLGNADEIAGARRATKVVGLPDGVPCPIG
jgi:hypothetical protein